MVVKQNTLIHDLSTMGGIEQQRRQQRIWHYRNVLGDFFFACLATVSCTPCLVQVFFFFFMLTQKEKRVILKSQPVSLYMVYKNSDKLVKTSSESMKTVTRQHTELANMAKKIILKVTE